MLLEENMTISKDCFKSSARAGMRRWFAGQVLIKMGNGKIRWRKHCFITEISRESCQKVITWDSISYP